MCKLLKKLVLKIKNSSNDKHVVKKIKVEDVVEVKDVNVRALRPGERSVENLWLKFDWHVVVIHCVYLYNL